MLALHAELMLDLNMQQKPNHLLVLLRPAGSFTKPKLGNHCVYSNDNYYRMTLFILVGFSIFFWFVFFIDGFALFLVLPLLCRSFYAVLKSKEFDFIIFEEWKQESNW